MQIEIETLEDVWRERYMKCPYCNEEMEDGILQAQRYILWTKKQHNLSYYPKEGDVLALIFRQIIKQQR